MAVHILNKASRRLDEHSISDSYAMYLQKFVDSSDKFIEDAAKSHQAIMTYDEFKEYYILNVLGRSSEFTESIARDFQYMALENWPKNAAENA